MDEAAPGDVVEALLEGRGDPKTRRRSPTPVPSAGMNCAGCGQENPEDAGFCGECGARLVRDIECPGCQRSNPLGQKFCNGCGQSLLDIDTSRTPPRPASYTPAHLADKILNSRSALEGERKTITALFADLKGSTALIEGIDPEEARATLDPALQIMMDAVHRYDGYVAQALGDGILALFGAPIAHEDHPQRALYAALRMQEDMRAYSDRSRLRGGMPVQMRVGVNTGEVVVRSIHKDDLHTDYVPVGHSTNLAARMEQIATPGSIVVSEHTHQLTEGFFEHRALGPAQIPGVSEPVPVYEVLGTGRLHTRFQVSAARGLSRFVGRHNESGQLRSALEQAQSGQGQVAGVMGEAGLGKSRLFHEFKATLGGELRVLEAYALSHGQSSPYLPVIGLLRHYFQIDTRDDDRTRRAKVMGHVLALDRSLESTLPYLFALLGVDDPDSQLRDMQPPVRRTRTFDALKRLLLRESLNQPVVLVFEDLHWIDTETQGVLDALVESVGSARVLLLANFRPEYTHEWAQKTYYTQLRLAPLSAQDAEALLHDLLGGDASLAAIKTAILEKTEGAPFFIEEVVQTLAEEGVIEGTRGHYALKRMPDELHISPTAQGVLAARIDRLPTQEKELLQRLSVVGRQFPLGLVHRVADLPEPELAAALASLQHKEFLYEQPAFPDVEYVFKHALTKDVAYDTLLQTRRSELHERTGKALENLYTGHLDDHYNDLAYHYAEAGNVPKAVDYLHRAGRQAVQRSANNEAINLLSKALDLLGTTREGSERGQRELEILLTLVPALVVSKNYASPEVAEASDRAIALAGRVGRGDQPFFALQGRWLAEFTLGKLPNALKTSEDLLELATRTGDPSLEVDGLMRVGTILTYSGIPAEGVPYLERAIERYDPERDAGMRFRTGMDPGLNAMYQGSYGRWMLGDLTASRSTINRGMNLGRELGSDFTYVCPLTYSASLHLLGGDYEKAQADGDAAHDLAAKIGWTWWEAMATIFRGSASTHLGDANAGVSEIRRGLDLISHLGKVCWWPHYQIFLSEACLIAGDLPEARRAAESGLERAIVSGERWAEPELGRLLGDIAVAESGDRGRAQAERHYTRAIEAAREVQSVPWELRAVTSLSRLWSGQGKTQEAYELLAPRVRELPDARDTKDLRTANALLAELRP